MSVGNLDAIRDFTDVRDMVKAYWLAMYHCDYGVPYNIASGLGYKIYEVLQMLLGMSTKKSQIEIVQDINRMRPSDVPILIGDSSKFRKKTGWVPEISFRKTLEDIMDYWRNNIQV